MRHLVGNDTVAPLGAARGRADADDAADAEIVAAALDLNDGRNARVDEATRAGLRRGSAPANRDRTARTALQAPLVRNRKSGSRDGQYT